MSNKKGKISKVESEATEECDEVKEGVYSRLRKRKPKPEQAKQEPTKAKVKKEPSEEKVSKRKIKEENSDEDKAIKKVKDSEKTAKKSSKKEFENEEEEMEQENLITKNKNNKTKEVKSEAMEEPVKVESVNENKGEEEKTTSKKPVKKSKKEPTPPPEEPEEELPIKTEKPKANTDKKSSKKECEDEEEEMEQENLITKNLKNNKIKKSAKVESVNENKGEEEKTTSKKPVKKSKKEPTPPPEEPEEELPIKTEKPKAKTDKKSSKKECEDEEEEMEQENLITKNLKNNKIKKSAKVESVNEEKEDEEEKSTSKKPVKKSKKEPTPPPEEPEEELPIKTEKPKAKTDKKSSKKECEDEEEEMEQENLITKNLKNNKIKKSAKVESVNEEKEDEEEKSTSKKPVKKSKKEPTPTPEEPEIKTIKFYGDIPVDEKFIELHGDQHKIYREGDEIYDCMLNQTNLQFNNNKYYLIQLLENVKSKEYTVWMRWGRVGKTGQTSCESCNSNLAKAKEKFTNKFYDKTKNYWEERMMFERVAGKYDLVEKEYGVKAEEAEKAAKKAVNKEGKSVPASKLNKRVQDLIELICNVSEMESILKEMKFDAKKAPLGKLSKNQIKAGYSALKKIEELVREGKTNGSEFLQANNDFYTRIPHDFGMKTPPMIRTLSEIQQKVKLLELLDDIEVAVRAFNQESKVENPIDRHYEQLECDLELLNRDDKMFKLIEEYLTKTHAPTHSSYKLKLVDVFEVRKSKEAEQFKDHGNRMLLWHGSRLTNWAGILRQGLRIAPPEAPVTGYMFGKGCYFADCSSKSANYCYTTSNKNMGLMSLSEVSLGVCNELKQADYNADKLPNGKHSTIGLGRAEPDRNEWVTLDDGCRVPVGRIKEARDSKEASSYSLLYNEYIVYDVSQIKMRYVLRVEFIYED